MFLFPGSFLDSLSRVNPRAHEGFAVLELWAVLLMVVVALVRATAAFGLWHCARWGYIMALAILSVNLLAMPSMRSSAMTGALSMVFRLAAR